MCDDYQDEDQDVPEETGLLTFSLLLVELLSRFLITFTFTFNILYLINLILRLLHGVLSLRVSHCHYQAIGTTAYLVKGWKGFEASVVICELN